GATLLLPTSTFGKNYVAFDSAYQSGYPSGKYYAIVASEDGTNVGLRPGKTPFHDGATTYPAGTPASFSLDKGQALILNEYIYDVTLGDPIPSGSPIDSDKPIGVFIGAQCMFVPQDASWCDGDHEQLAPVQAVGNEYVAARPRDRYDGVVESPPWVLV